MGAHVPPSTLWHARSMDPREPNTRNLKEDTKIELNNLNCLSTTKRKILQKSYKKEVQSSDVARKSRQQSCEKNFPKAAIVTCVTTADVARII